MKKNPPPSLRPHESAAVGLHRMVRQLVEGALALIERPTGDPGEDIRHLRVSLKRLRALLLLIRPGISEKAFARENARLRDATRRLARSRDTEAARETLRTIAKSAEGKRARAALAEVLHGFHRAVQPPDTADRSAALREVAAALRQSAKKILRLRLPADGWKAIGPGLEEVYRAGRKRMKRALARNDDVASHRWRIRAKGLFYQLEMLLPVWPARLCKMVARLKKFQRKAGDNHDLAVLKSVLEAAPDAFGGACAIQRVISCMDRKSRKLRKVSGKLGVAIYRQKPGNFVGQLEKRWGK